MNMGSKSEMQEFLRKPKVKEFSQGYVWFCMKVKSELMVTGGDFFCVSGDKIIRKILLNTR